MIIYNINFLNDDLDFLYYYYYFSIYANYTHKIFQIQLQCTYIHNINIIQLS